MNDFMIGDKVTVKESYLSELEEMNKIQRYPVGTKATVVEISRCLPDEVPVVGIQKSPGDPIWYYYTYELQYEFDTEGEYLRQSNEVLAKFIEEELLISGACYPVFNGMSVLDWLNQKF